ncbi:hypothetical protein RJ639_009124 [Escallonia herrerae]|uniref:H(+)-transporting two-sector ATPase n=1 Tax=Escallonia herrerae TaxID=1293975 RepID=A0AA88VVL2_9ASTE|nr:hypothetical protein RJ639_009124 [Escallonia herrerae]
MGSLQEKITSTKEGSITFIQAVYVPADYLTDPAPVTTFAYLDATTVLSRGLAAKGIYPAIDPLDSTSTMLSDRNIDEATAKAMNLEIESNLRNGGQIGALPSHAPIATTGDIGILRIRLDDQWLTAALMGGFARIGNDLGEANPYGKHEEKGIQREPLE